MIGKASAVEMRIIARISTPFDEKFGVPRQSGLVDTASKIVFEPEFRSAEAVRGLEGFSHLWLLWHIDRNGDKWSPTVRPPRLGGNRRLGVFATRSPFRPNSIGLSCVKILGLEETEEFGTVIHVGGADLMDGTPIFDIKPYIPYADAHPEALGGFTQTAGDFILNVEFPSTLLQQIPVDKQDALIGVLSHDPRPSYQQDPQRIYGLSFGSFDVRFRVSNETLTVVEVNPL